MLSVKQGSIKYVGMIWPGIELGSPEPLANTLTFMPMFGIHLNDSNYGYVSITILLNIIHLFSQR